MAIAEVTSTRNRKEKQAFLSLFSRFSVTLHPNSDVINMEENTLTYEAAIEQLEKQAKEMENGDIAIDQLATKLSEAQQLLQFCKDKLTKAEDEVRKLLEE